MFALSQGARDQYIAKIIQECPKSKYYLLFLSKVKHWYGLLLFCEVILLPYRRLCRFVLMREIGLEARAEIDVPAPELPAERLGILVVMRS